MYIEYYVAACSHHRPRCDRTGSRPLLRACPRFSLGWSRCAVLHLWTVRALNRYADRVRQRGRASASRRPLQRRLLAALLYRANNRRASWPLAVGSSGHESVSACVEQWCESYRCTCSGRWGDELCGREHLWRTSATVLLHCRCLLGTGVYICFFSSSVNRMTQFFTNLIMFLLIII